MIGNKWFSKFLSNIINKIVLIPKVQETTALGAAFMAGLNIGVYKSLSDISEYEIPFSSRNVRLDKEDLLKASKVSQAIKKLFFLIKKNFKNKDKITDIKKFIKCNNINLQYLEIRNKNNLSSNFNQNNFKIFVAFFIKKIRLIDNV